MVTYILTANAIDQEVVVQVLGGLLTSPIFFGLVQTTLLKQGFRKSLKTAGSSTTHAGQKGAQ